MSDLQRLRELAGMTSHNQVKHEIQQAKPMAADREHYRDHVAKQLGDNAGSDFDKSFDQAYDEEFDIDEGYQVLPGIDHERYTDMSGEGLEGPFRLESGKVVYYDPKVGQYYDRDTDMYLDNDDVEIHRQSSFNESAPPGMEAVVKKLKHQYPGEPEKAFATAWSIYNKKHGKTDESAMNNMTETRKKSIDPAAISEIASMPHDQAKQQALELLDTSYTDEQKKIDLRTQIENSRNTIGVAKILYNMVLSGEGLGVIKSKDKFREGYTGDSAVDEEIDRILESASNSFVEKHDAIQHVSNYLLEAGLTFEQMMSAVEAVAAGLGETHDFIQDEDDYTDYSMRQGEMGNPNLRSGLSQDQDQWEWDQLDDEYDDDDEECLDDDCFEITREDMNNGYGSECITDPQDRFPTGADGAVTAKSGPSGARQGDNPEQKVMAMEMARLKQKFNQLLESLNESGLGSAQVKSVTIVDYTSPITADRDSFSFNGTLMCETDAIDSHGQSAELAYALDVSFSGKFTVSTDDDFSGNTVFDVQDVNIDSFQAEFSSRSDVEFYLNGEVYSSADEFVSNLDPSLSKELQSLTPAMDQAISRDLKLPEVIDRAIGSNAPTPSYQGRAGFLGR